MVKVHDKEEIILKAAMDVFVEKGLYGAKMQEIADKAGINKALLHYYYRSKNKLYEHIFRFIFTKIFKDIIELMNTKLPFKEVLRYFISEYIDLLINNHKFPMFIMREISYGGKIASNVINDVIMNEMNCRYPVIDIIEDAMEKGEIIKMDPNQIIITVLGSCLFYFMGENLIRTVLLTKKSFD